MNTIAAIGTAPGMGAIGVLRLSGPLALSITQTVFHAQCKTSIEQFVPRKLYLGTLQDASGAVLDQCLCTISRGPHSYTGEDTAEFHCHGSPALLHAGLEALFQAGAVAAAAGEFTKRAFLNGKLDLVQAEAVVDLIHAETAEIAKNAAGQLEGALSQRMDGVYKGLADILSHFHAVVDYYDEDIEDFQLEDYCNTMEAYGEDLRQLAASFDRGKRLVSGVKTAILGLPNVGKSSLLNALLGYERAIVTDIAGTTRDTLEERVLLGGVLLSLIDTAGLRSTEDPIEQEGVTRARQAADQADLVFCVFDGSRPLSPEDRALIASTQGMAQKIAIINKTDLKQELDKEALVPYFSHVLEISAKSNRGLEGLEALIAKLYPKQEGPAGHILTNPRQVSAVLRAADSVAEARAAARAGITPDAVLTEIEAAMEALGELSGRTIREDVVSRIFERFCVGK